MRRVDEVVVGGNVGRSHRMARLGRVQRRVRRVRRLRGMGEGRLWLLLGMGRVVER